jgi:hypothetical protein
MEQKIAILVTSFLRDNLLYETVNNILRYMPQRSAIFVGNQSYKTDEERLNGFTRFNVNIDNTAHFPINYYNLLFDCGLSYARNFLVQEAHKQNYDYCLLLADSIQFTEYKNFYEAIDFLETNEKYALVGFDLLNSKCSWEFNLALADGGIKLIPSVKHQIYHRIIFKEIEICRNVFLAKTAALLDSPWDNDLKLAEHEKFFIDFKNKEYKCFWTNHWVFKRCDSQNSAEYNKYRARFGEYVDVLKKKLNLNRWVIYPR